MPNDTTPVPIGADGALALLVAAVEAETDPSWECNSYHPSLWSALDVARAALASAAQPAPAPTTYPEREWCTAQRAFIRGWDQRGMAHGLKGSVETDCRMRDLMNVFFPRDPTFTAQPAPAPAAVAGPLNELEELNLLNKLIHLGARAASAHAKSNSDDGHAGTAAYVEWSELRADMGELIRKAYAAPTPAARAAKEGNANAGS